MLKRNCSKTGLERQSTSLAEGLVGQPGLGLWNGGAKSAKGNAHHAQCVRRPRWPARMAVRGFVNKGPSRRTNFRPPSGRASPTINKTPCQAQAVGTPCTKAASTRHRRVTISISRNIPPPSRLGQRATCQYSFARDAPRTAAGPRSVCTPAHSIWEAALTSTRSSDRTAP